MTRYVRFLHDGMPRYGRLEGAEVAVIDPHPFAQHRPTGEVVPVAGLQLLAPVIPSKVIGAGRNYRSVVAARGGELPEEPALFLKASSTVIGPGEPIRLPTDLSDDVAHEGEVAVVIGALLQRVDPEQAAAGVFGVTAANDLTARDLQRREHQWFRAKSFDSATPLGPAIATDLDLGALQVRCLVDGELRQEGSTDDLVFSIPELVSAISQTTTLLPGDVVLTGSPGGEQALVPGQQVRVEVDGVGALENPVVDRNAPVGGAGAASN